MMTCKETERAFSPYLDGELARTERASVEEHLDLCPVCRLELDRMRSLVRGLAFVERPEAPRDLASAISDALMIERAARAQRPPVPFSERLARWLQPHLMPYAVGAFYSLLLFGAVFGALRNHMIVLRDLAEDARAESEERPYRVTWVRGDAESPGGYDVTQPLSPALYAAGRSPYAAESPSLNPRGALARLAGSPSTGQRPDDDDMIIVADVYGNGRASLAEVIEAPRNPRMLDELQDALRKNPAFVPASYDRRPQTMRVVFALQKMQVEDRVF
ncbi:MAG TPA: zf-HC2 domain-containing protein [Pyrinomonadaceae bacterium]|nr:zf-HC2 domain-containing protein [Pyrinomonadaceae bacterium]